MTPDQINDLIQQLLNTGEILASQAYILAMRQILLKTILDAVSIVICFILILVINRLVDKLYKEDGNYKYDNTGKYDDLEEPISVVVAIGRFLTWAVFPFVMVVNLFYVISYLVNPSWYAIELLITTFLK